MQGRGALGPGAILTKRSLLDQMSYSILCLAIAKYAIENIARYFIWALKPAVAYCHGNQIGY